jgi:hypothetical protein
MSSYALEKASFYPSNDTAHGRFPLRTGQKPPEEAGNLERIAVAQARRQSEKTASAE